MVHSAIMKKKGERGALSVMACASGRELAQRIVTKLNTITSVILSAAWAPLPSLEIRLPVLWVT